MATKYEEMCEAARCAQQDEAQYQHRCFRHMTALFNGFVSYCGIPRDKVTLLRWNGAPGQNSRFAPPEAAMCNDVLDTMVLDQDGFWRVGIRINLISGSIFFAFWIAEQDGVVVTKIADQTYRLDLAIQQKCNDFYDEVVTRVKIAFSNRKKSKAKTIGFIVEPAVSSV